MVALKKNCLTLGFMVYEIYKKQGNFGFIKIMK